MEYITAEDSLADAERRRELNVGLRGITKCFGLWALLLAALVMVVLWRIIPRGKPHVIFASEVEEAQKRRALQQYAVVVEQIGREDTHQKNKEEDKDSKEKSTVVGVRPFYGIDFLNEVLCTESFRALFYDFVQRCLPEGKPNRRFLDHLADALLSDEGGFAEMSGILRPPAQTTQNAEVESPEVKSAKSRVCYLASRQVLHLLAEDPDLNYLLTWMAQRPGLLSLVPPSLWKTFHSLEGSSSKKESKLDPAAVLLLLGLLGSAQFAGGYLANKISETRLERLSDEFTERMSTIESHFSKLSESIQSSQTSENLKEKEEQSYSYYYPVFPPVGTDGSKGETPTRKGGPIVQYCGMDSDTGFGGKKDAKGNIITPADTAKIAEALKTAAEKDGVLQVCWPYEQTIPLPPQGGGNGGGAGTSSGESVLEPGSDILVYFANGDTTPKSVTIRYLDEPMERSYTLQLTDVQGWPPEPIQLTISNKEETKSTYKTFVGKTPTYDPKMNADLSLEESSRQKSFLWLKYGKDTIVVRISPRPLRFAHPSTSQNGQTKP